MSPPRGDADNKWHHLFCVLQPGPEDLVWPESQPWGVWWHQAIVREERSPWRASVCAPTSGRRRLPRQRAPPLLPGPRPPPAPKVPCPQETRAPLGAAVPKHLHIRFTREAYSLPCVWLSVSSDELNQTRPVGDGTQHCRV